MFTNISYFLYYHSYLHLLQWISLFKEALISATHLANPKSTQLLVVFIDIPLALYIVFKFFKPDIKKFNMPYLKHILIFVCVVLLIITESNNYKDGESLVNYISDRYTGEAKIVERYGTTVNGVINIMQNYNENKLIEHFQYGAELKSNSSNSAVIYSKPNYVFIQVESMDANIVRQQFNNSYIMPNLKSLSENNVYYPFTLSYHKGGGTSDAEFSMINSVEPLDVSFDSRI
jgi:phosphoglycerol transferase MdoB-like AlkP superfamily enzyme